MSAPPPPNVDHNPFLPPDLPETQEARDAAAAAAAEDAALAAATGPSVFDELKKIHQRQREQTQLIANMQSVISGLSAKQAELEGEIRDLKGGRWVVKAEPKSYRARREHGGGRGNFLSVGDGGIEGNTEDIEIDQIIETRRAKKLWPLKRKYCSSFTNEVDLLKVRFHRSVKHDHKSIRIPKVDQSGGYGLGNKEGRLICRLCSGKTINRNTSWMCVTCCVPLCVDVVNGDPESSCHARWHSCQDLVAVNHTLNAALREKRESKKRARDSQKSAEERAEAARRRLASDAVAAMPPPEVPPMQVAEPKMEDAGGEVQQKVEDPGEAAGMMGQEQHHVQVDPIVDDPNSEEVIC